MLAYLTKIIYLLTKIIEEPKTQIKDINVVITSPFKYWNLLFLYKQQS